MGTPVSQMSFGSDPLQGSIVTVAPGTPSPLSVPNTATFYGASTYDPMAQALGMNGVGYGSMPFYNPSPVPQTPLVGGVMSFGNPAPQQQVPYIAQTPSYAPVPTASTAPVIGGVNTSVTNPVSVSTNVGVTNQTAAPVNNYTNFINPLQLQNLAAQIPLNPSPGPVQRTNPYNLLASAAGPVPTPVQNLGGAPSAQPMQQSMPADFPQMKAQQPQQPSLQGSAAQAFSPSADNLAAAAPPQLFMPPMQQSAPMQPQAPSLMPMPNGGYGLQMPTGAGDQSTTSGAAPASTRPGYDNDPRLEAAYQNDLRRAQQGEAPIDGNKFDTEAGSDANGTPQAKQPNLFQRAMKRAAYALDPRQQYNDQYRDYLKAAAADRAAARKEESESEDRKYQAQRDLEELKQKHEDERKRMELLSAGSKLTYAEGMKALGEALDTPPNSPKRFAAAQALSASGYLDRIGRNPDWVLNMPQDPKAAVEMSKLGSEEIAAATKAAKDALTAPYEVNKSRSEDIISGVNANNAVANAGYEQSLAQAKAAQAQIDLVTSSNKMFKDAQTMPAEILKPYLDNQKAAKDLSLTDKAALLKGLSENPAFLMSPQGQSLYQQVMESLGGYAPGTMAPPVKQPNETPQQFAARQKAGLPPAPVLQGGVGYSAMPMQAPSGYGLVPPPPPNAIPTGAINGMYPPSMNQMPQPNPMAGGMQATYKPAFGQPRQDQGQTQTPAGAPQQQGPNPLQALGNILTKPQGAPPPMPVQDPNAPINQFGRALQAGAQAWQQSNEKIASDIQRQRDLNNRIVETEIPGPVAQALKLMSPHKVGADGGGILTDPQIKDYLVRQASNDARRFDALLKFAGWGGVDWQDNTPQLPRISPSRNPKPDYKPPVPAALPPAPVYDPNAPINQIGRQIQHAIFAPPQHVPPPPQPLPRPMIPMPTMGLLPLPPGAPRIVNGMPTYGLLQ